ncbi:MAG: DUF177 domain-containing protein [Fibrobacter sp.]|nr:DUF177 domain-containing protein [Fibrobacter sp.]
MVIDTRLIAEGHSSLSGTTGLESVKNELPDFSDNINYRAEVDRVGPTIFVHVWFEGLFKLECARCLNEVDFPLSGEFRITIKEQFGKSGQAFDDDAVDFYYDTRQELVDISPAFFDEIMTAVPLMPLCSEDCKGIDISGVKNLNVEYKNVSIVKRETDPRWDALKKLKLK